MKIGDLRARFGLASRHSMFGILLLFGVGSAVGLELLSRLIGAQGATLFWQEFSLGDGPIAWLMPALIVMAIPLARLTHHWPWAGAGRFLQRHIAWFCVGSALFYAALMFFAALRLAYTPDESSAVLQGQTFAALRFTPQVAPDLVASIVPGWLQGNILLVSTETGRYSPTYWPGYALIMAPFARFGIEWLCNPILSALSLGLLFGVTAKGLGRREAGVWAVVFAFASPQIALNAATFYAMPAHLLFNLLFCWFFLLNTRRAAFCGGLVGGYALILHNPVPHLSFALPWIWWIWKTRRSQLGPLLIGYALLALPIGIGWSLYLDGFHISPYVGGASLEQATKITDSSAFSQIMSRVAYVFRPPDAFLLLSRAAGLLKIGLWSSPGVFALAWLGWRGAAQFRRTQNREAPAENEFSSAHFLWLLGVSVAFNLAVYLFIRYDQGHGWGFRYEHQTYFALPILSAYFVIRNAEIRVLGSSLRRFCAVLCVLGVGVVLPLRAVQARVFVASVLRDQPPVAPRGSSLTFVREGRGEAGTFIINDPFLRSDNWKLRFLSPASNAQLARRYLAQARRIRSGKWGEIWSGTAFLRSPSPAFRAFNRENLPRVVGALP